MVLIPYADTNQLPKGGVAEEPTLEQIPRIPRASPLRFQGTISATYAEDAVGLKPVENPCKNRISRKPATVWTTGYNIPQSIQAKTPKYMMGSRPIVSVSFPLNGLEIPAVSVNNARINPMY